MAASITKRFIVAAMAGTLAASSLSACAVSAGTAPAPTEAASPTVVELLTPGRPVTVIDRGDGTELCLGGLLQSIPPGCADGIDLSGWDWDAVPGTYDAVGGTRWGEYLVTGTYDDTAATFTVTSSSDGADFVWPDVAEDPITFSTKCTEPEHGWQIIDESRATLEALNAATDVAAQIDGYAVTWIDDTLVPPVPANTDPLAGLHHYAVHAGRNILNVAIRGDVAAAETRLREVWGGALCVVTADHTAAELDTLVQEIVQEYGYTVGSDGMTGTVYVSAPYDRDGALQQELDDRYGDGRIVVQSALEPV
ncbi:hypothetical protein [Microbacterium sp. A84]|uniref:hypothetical protein n=1 Tax=Microbacterium sp. A84 TaxID=3450715 RepID=UPI003F4314F7